jgi:hypothetical protein
MKKTLSLVLLSSTLLSLPPARAFEALPTSVEICDDNFGEKALTQILALDVAQFGIELFNGLEVGGKYKNDVKPSYNDGLYTRTDKYLLRVGAGSLVPELREGQDSDFIIGARLEDETEVIFNRQFKDRKMARCAKPYGTKNMPLNAAKTLANLQPGEYFSLRSKMAIIVSGTFLTGIGIESMGLSAAGKYSVSGIFQTHVLRMPDGKVRLKLVGLKRNEKGIEVASEFLKDLKIIGVSLADKAITSYLDLNPLDYILRSGRNNALIVEYVIDLKDPAAAKAYDYVINKVTDIEDIKENSTAVKSLKKVKKNMILDVEAIDAIARADQGSATPRVSRAFSATVDSKYTTSNLDLGIRLIHLNLDNSSTENRISSINSDENYVVNSYTKKLESGALFSVRSTAKETKMDAVFSSDDKFQNLSAEDFVISVENREKTLSQNEFKRFKADVRRMLPPEISSKMDYSQWIQVKQKRKNGYSRIQIALHPEAISAIGPMNQRDLEKRLVQYVGKMIGEGLASRSQAEHMWGDDIEHMARQVRAMLDPTKSDKKRLGALMRLRSNSMFQKIGMRFILELLPENKREDLIKVQVKMDTTDGDRAFLNYGKVDPAAVFAWNRSTLALLGDEGIDLRLEAEAIKMQGN